MTKRTSSASSLEIHFLQEPACFFKLRTPFAVRFKQCVLLEIRDGQSPAHIIELNPGKVPFGARSLYNYLAGVKGGDLT